MEYFFKIINNKYSCTEVMRLIRVTYYFANCECYLYKDVCSI